MGRRRKLLGGPILFRQPSFASERVVGLSRQGLTKHRECICWRIRHRVFSRNDDFQACTPGVQCCPFLVVKTVLHVDLARDGALAGTHVVQHEANGVGLVPISAMRVAAVRRKSCIRKYAIPNLWRPRNKATVAACPSMGPSLPWLGWGRARSSLAHWPCTLAAQAPRRLATQPTVIGVRGAVHHSWSARAVTPKRAPGHR